MIYYVNTDGSIIGGTQSDDINGITALHSAAYAVYIDDATVNSITNNGTAQGTLSIAGLTAGAPNRYGIPTATGTLTFTATPAATLLANAQTAKKVSLTASFNNSLQNGFASSADGTSRTYAIDMVSMGKWNGVLSNINSGMLTANIVVKDFNGNKVTLTPAQFKQMASDAFTFYNNQENHLWSLEDQVNAATTVDAVNAVTW